MKISVRRLCDVKKMDEIVPHHADTFVLCVDGELAPGQIATKLETGGTDQAQTFTVTFEMLDGIVDLEVLSTKTYVELDS